MTSNKHPVSDKDPSNIRDTIIGGAFAIGITFIGCAIFVAFSYFVKTNIL